MKRIISFTVVFLIAVCALLAALPAMAETPQGTAVKNESDFLAMDKDGEYYLANNITISASYANSFAGILDGNGYKIKIADGANVSPFKKIEGATFKDLTVEGVINVKSKTSYGGIATEGGSYTDPNKQPLTTVISTDKMKGIGALTKEGGMTGLSSAFVETSSYPILEVFKESLTGEHGVYFPLHRVIDYSKYTVNAAMGGNSWGPNDCKNGAAWFSTVTDETATGGKYLKFKAPHSSGAYPSAWLGHYGITMTPTGVYGGSGDENLTLENGTTYRVTMRMRTVELSGKAMSLFVVFGEC